MPRHTTWELPEDLIRRAEAYAAENNTSLTELVRRHLEGITGAPRSDLGSRPMPQGDRPKEEVAAAVAGLQALRKEIASRSGTVAERRKRISEAKRVRSLAWIPCSRSS